MELWFMELNLKWFGVKVKLLRLELMLGIKFGYYCHSGYFWGPATTKKSRPVTWPTDFGFYYSE